MKFKYRPKHPVRLVALILVALVVTLIWWRFTGTEEPVKTINTDLPDSVLEQQAARFNEPKASVTISNPEIKNSYLQINEWGVKLKLRDAEKIYYEYREYSYAQYGQEVSSVKLMIKDQFLKNKNCKFSVEWTRYEKLDEYLKDVAVKLGDYYFVNGNEPFACPESEDSSLYKNLLADLNNIELL